MAVVYVKAGENIESCIRRFKKEVDKERIIKELKERRFYKKPALVRKIESVRLEKRLRRGRKRPHFMMTPRRPSF